MNYRTVYKMSNINNIIVEDLVKLCFNNNEDDAKNKIDDKVKSLDEKIYLNYNELDLHNIFRKYYQISKVNIENNYYNNFLYLCKIFNVKKKYYNVNTCVIL